jgi:hypothetical protein
MADNWQLKAVISAADRISPTLKHIQRNFRGLHKAGLDIASATRGVLSHTALLLAPVMLGGVAAARSMTRTAATFERFETILATIEGSSAQAQASMRWISDFASKTPYELAEVTEAFVKLRAYGIDPITNQALTSLGDTAAAMGKPLMQAVEAMADAMTGENERLKEFGIRAQKTGQWLIYQYSSAGKTMQARAKANSREHIQATLQAIWQQKYAGSMNKLSGTWSGMLSNLSDQWARFTQMIMGSGAFTWMQSRLRGVLEQLDALSANGTLQQWASEIGQAVQELFTALAGRPIHSAAAGLLQLKNGLLAMIHASAHFVRRLQWMKDKLGGWRNFLLALFVLINSSLIGSILGLAGALLRFGRVLLGFNIGAVLVGVGKAALLLGRAIMLTPVGIVLSLVAATYLLYKNWDAVKTTVGRLFQQLPTGMISALGRIHAEFQQLLDLAQALPLQVWRALKLVAQRLRSIWLEPRIALTDFIHSVIDKIQALFSRLTDILRRVREGFKSILGPGLRTMLPGFDPSSSVKQAATASLFHQPSVAQHLNSQPRLSGEMVVRFEGAPPGLRAHPGRTNLPGVSFNPDVGYRTAYGGMP